MERERALRRKEFIDHRARLLCPLPGTGWSLWLVLYLAAAVLGGCVREGGPAAKATMQEVPLE